MFAPVWLRGVCTMAVSSSTGSCWAISHRQHLHRQQERAHGDGWRRDCPRGSWKHGRRPGRRGKGDLEGWGQRGMLAV